MATPQNNEVKDALIQFDLGMNGGVSADLLEKNQLSDMRNATVRGDFVTDRPPYTAVTVTIPPGGPSDWATAGCSTNWGEASQVSKFFQGCCYCQPDEPNTECIMVVMGGRLFKFTPDLGTSTATVEEIPLSGSSAGTPINDPVPSSSLMSNGPPQAWLWQAENYVIWQDGSSTPLYYNSSETNDKALTRGAITVPKTQLTDVFTVPNLNESNEIRVSANFTGDNIIALINSYQYLLTITPAGNTNTITLKEKSTTSGTYSVNQAIWTNPNYIGDTTASFNVPAKTVDRVPGTNVPLNIVATTPYDPGSGVLQPSVHLQGTYKVTKGTTPSAQLSVVCYSAVSAGQSGNVVFDIWPTETYRATIITATAVQNGSSTEYHCTIKLTNPNNYQPKNFPGNQYFYINTVRGFAYTSVTTPAGPQPDTYDPAPPSAWAGIPTLVTLRIGDYDYVCQLSAPFSDSTPGGTMSAVATLLNYNSAVHGEVSPGTFYGPGYLPIKLMDYIPPVTTPSSAGNLQSIINALGNGNSVDILDSLSVSRTYHYSSVKVEPDGLGTATVTFSVDAANDTVKPNPTSLGQTFTYIVAGASHLFTITNSTGGGVAFGPFPVSNAGTPAIEDPIYITLDTPVSQNGTVTSPVTAVSTTDKIVIGNNVYNVLSVSNPDGNTGSIKVENTGTAPEGSSPDPDGTLIASGVPIWFYENPTTIDTTGFAPKGKASAASAVLLVGFAHTGTNASYVATIKAPYKSQLKVNVFVTADASTSPTITSDRYKLTDGTVAGTAAIVHAMNLNDTSGIATYGKGTFVQYGVPQLPVGKMGAYVMGRNWVCLPDGQSFVASDIVGASSGTKSLRFRDAVLNLTENTYIVGGGTFTVPGTAGHIRAIISAPTLDASLGQGPVQVFTPNTVFSCNAPVDRASWTKMTTPILSESVINNGALSQDATVVANSDIVYRSLDGIRSLILSRSDFNQWNRTPISREVSNTLDQDNPQYLEYASSIVFDNRLLTTSGPTTGPAGIYHPNLVVLNFDTVSSIRGKQPAVWEGVWTVPNILKMVKGTFRGVERAFAFCWDSTTNSVFLIELLPDRSNLTNDNGDTPILWQFSTPNLDFGQRDPRSRELLRLLDAEMYLSDLNGPLSLWVFWRPDYDTTWHPWRHWSIPATPKYQPRMGLGEPPLTCDNATGRPWREGYSFQLLFIIQGHAVFNGARFLAVRLPSTKFAPMFPNPTAAKVTPTAEPVGALTDEEGNFLTDENGNPLFPDL